MRSVRVSVAALMSVGIALLVVPAVGSGAAHGGKAPAKPGLVYGGKTAQHAPVWLRLSNNRRTIADLHLAWRASNAQCTNGKPMVMPEDLGAENGFPTIKVRAGKFDSTVPEDAGAPDGTGPESFTIVGTVTDAAISGTFSAKVTINVSGGGQYVCTLPRTRFSAVN